MEKVPVVIIGGGLTGLSTAHHLKRGYLLLEKEDRVGGLAVTEQSGGFSWDRTGHWLHLRHPRIRSLVQDLLGEDGLLTVQRRSRIFSSGGFTHYPFQAHTHGLPPEVVEECLLGFIHAWHRRESAEAGDEPESFEQWILYHFGAGIARHFMVPYNNKLWGVHPREITARWCERFVPRPSLEDVVGGAVGRKLDIGYNAVFSYPAAGGIGLLAEALSASLDRVELGCSVAAVSHRQRVAILSDGRRVSYERLVSTTPLPYLLDMMDDLPPQVAGARAALRWTSVGYLHLGVRGEVNQGHHWIYVPERDFCFYRVGSYSNAVAHMAPEGCGSLYVEFNTMGRPVDWKEMVPAMLGDLSRAGLVDPRQEILVQEHAVIPVAYVVFDHGYFEALETIFPFLEAHGILSRGRYGRWIYNSMEDSLVDGVETALYISDQGVV